jgi:putative ABC transport system permease protein
MAILIQDIRYALRGLRSHPLFTVIAVLTLGLGIGANTAIFSVLDAVVLQPLPYAQPDRLISVTRDAGRGEQLSFPDLRDVRSGAKTVREVASFRYWLFNLSGPDHPQSLLGIYVGDSIFDALQVHPALGRLFRDDVESTSAAREVVISYALWQRRFAADRAVIGSSAVIDGQPTVIIGVLPHDFRFPDLVPASTPLPSREPDVYIPVGLESYNDLDVRGNDNYWAIARLRTGATLNASVADFGRMAATLAHDHPDYDKGIALFPVPLQTQVIGPAARPIGILFGAVVLVLLIACANVGGLLLARAVERRREVGIRKALGASLARLARQLLTESIVLALAGGALGVGIAAWGVALVRAMAPANVPRIDQVTLNPAVLLFALIGSLCAGVLFGLAPVLLQRRDPLASVLREGGRTGSAASRRWRAVLVAAELALAMVLLSGAGLLLRSFARLSRVDPGFDTTNLMTMFTLLPPGRYADAPHIVAYERHALAALNHLPGVVGAVTTNTLPLSNIGSNTDVDVVGHLAATPADRHEEAYRLLGGRYFHVLGIPIVSGRDFAVADSAGAPPVVIINQAAAKQLFPGEDPLGHQLIVYTGNATPRTIVGVSRDVRGVALDSVATSEVSLPVEQNPELILSLAIRTRGDPHLELPAIRHALSGIDPDQAYYAERSMDDLLSASLAVRRFDLQLVGAFAALALILAAVGLYGVIAFSVTQQRREFGIRAALGAERAEITRMVLLEGARLAAIGAVVGLIVTVLMSRLLQGLLYQVPVADPLTLVAVTAFLAAVVLIACYLPARRASRVDPVTVMRE